MKDLQLSCHYGGHAKRSIGSRFGAGILKVLVFLSVVTLQSLMLDQLSYAEVTGRILGTVVDASGAVLAGTQVTATDAATLVAHSVVTNAQGYYTFAALPPGTYSVSVEAPGYKAFVKKGVLLNVNDALNIDIALEVGKTEEVVTVSSDSMHLETASTQLGEVIEGNKITAVPLNGRSYTDLLALQPGVAATSSGLGGGASSNEAFQTGGFQFAQVSGDENPGNLSVNGMRESANGYLLNGISVQESGFSGTAVIPDLDSIAEFRIITNNFDAEYGNFFGGQVNVITKSGADQVHGSAFDFLRNTDLDAANYFDQGKRGVYQHNQFGGTLGGPIRRGSIFYFGDYQGERKKFGVSSGQIGVPTTAERGGDFSAASLAQAMSGATVQGSAWAQTLSHALNYTITAGEPYYSSGCTSSSQCVFPNAKIPDAAISQVAKNILKVGAIPLGDGQGNFSSGAYFEIINDNKFSTRVDANSRFGSLFGYYFRDGFDLTNPYPSATVPGFGSQTNGKTQAVNLGLSSPIGAKTFNEFRLGYVRVDDLLNSPAVTKKTTLSALGFDTGSAPGDIYVLDSATDGLPEMDFENFVTGDPIRIPHIKENNYQAADTFSLLLGTHSFRFGVSSHLSTIQQASKNVENGYFQFNQTLETGVDFADFLIGAPGVFVQGQAMPTNTESFYLGAFAQDSWRIRPGLTVNFGLRWDLITPWWEKHNELETLNLGLQSVIFPNSPTGWVFPGDPGIPRTIAPVRYDNFAPRFGLAWAPTAKSNMTRKLLGETSFRAAYGMFYSAFEGAYNFSIIGDAPFGYYYAASGPSLANPYVTRATGVVSPSPFPYIFPSAGFSASNPDSSVPASAFGVIGTSPGFDSTNRVPYAEQYELSMQRQLSSTNLLTLSYVGTQAHRLLASREVNPVNSAQCLALYQLNPSSPTCGPNSEPTSLRGPYGANFGSEALFSTIGTSAFNSLQINFKHQSGPLDLLAGYTWSKSLDLASAFGEQVNPSSSKLSRGLSAFNIPQSVVISYRYNLPFNRLNGPKLLVNGWQFTGVTSFSSGVPIYIYENDDSSLLGTNNSGPLPLGIDTPNYSGGKVKTYNPRNKNGYFFDTSGFSAETIGSLGTARRRFFSGPGMNNFNMSFIKETELPEHMKLQLRAEFFNIFNHAQFLADLPVAGNYNSSSFGKVTRSADPRIGQVALKLMF